MYVIFIYRLPNLVYSKIHIFGELADIKSITNLPTSVMGKLYSLAEYLEFWSQQPRIDTWTLENGDGILLAFNKRKGSDYIKISVCILSGNFFLLLLLILERKNLLTP